jgi:hypothetical protein
VDSYLKDNSSPVSTGEALAVGDQYTDYKKNVKAGLSSGLKKRSNKAILFLVGSLLGEKYFQDRSSFRFFIYHYPFWGIGYWQGMA